MRIVRWLFTDRNTNGIRTIGAGVLALGIVNGSLFPALIVAVLLSILGTILETEPEETA